MNENVASGINNYDKMQLTNLIKIGIIRQLHADKILNDKQYTDLLAKNKSKKFDNPPCFQ